MSTQTNTISSSTQEEFILSCLEQIRPMVINLTRGVDVDDAMQEAAIIIMQTLPKMSQEYINPVSFMSRVVKNRLIDLYRRRHHLVTSSLDASAAAGHDIECEDQTPDATVRMREEALYQSLERLPQEEQAYLTHKFALDYFLQISTKQHMTWQRSARSISTTAYRHLRSDQQLRDAILSLGPA